MGYEVLIFLSINILTYLSIIKYKGYLFKFYPDYNPIQKIHDGYVPPVGGLVTALIFYSYLLTLGKTNSFFVNFYVLLPCLAIIFIGAVEDLFGKTSPFLRLFIIFFSSLAYVYNLETLPTLEIYLLGEIVNEYRLLQIIFFSICLTALTNGFNMIDGMNGLIGLTSIAIIGSLIAIIKLFLLDIPYEQDLFYLGIFLLVFLFFNFPFGRIFFGDAGSYWVGWILGAITIDIFSDIRISTWGAVLILFYPSTEVVFSTIRKLYQKKNPLMPDLNHLHIKVYYLLSGGLKRNQNFNSFTTLCLMPFWILPLVSVIWISVYSHFAMIIYLILIIVYLIYYSLIPKKS